MEDKLDKLLVLLLAEPADEALARELLAETEGSQAVLGEAEVKVVGDCERAGGSVQARSVDE